MPETFPNPSEWEVPNLSLVRTGDGNPAVVETNPELLGMEEMLSAEARGFHSEGARAAA